LLTAVEAEVVEVAGALAAVLVAWAAAATAVSAVV
jgi:hypothetical protein